MSCCGTKMNKNSNNMSNKHADRFPDDRDNIAGIVDETDMYFFGIVGMFGLCTFFIVFGMVTNTINIIVFLRVGFKDTINISLFALAISDFLSCLTMAPCVVGINPFITYLDLPVNWTQIAHIVGAWPHVAFTKITTLITAFITVERCLCVFIPLKVKTLITRKKVKGYLIGSYLFVLMLLACLCYSNQLGWTFSSELNRTILGLVLPPEREDIEKVVIPILNALISVFAFLIIIISTIVLVVTLKRKAQWRIEATLVGKANHNSTPPSDKSTMTTKEQRISKMVVMISVLFIASLLPSVVSLLLLWADRRFDFGGPYASLFVIIALCNYILETVNASLNIFIYHKNSSNYKAAFDEIFCSKNVTKQNI